ncbi:BRO-N domain-containing protein [Acinetobacter junii]|uniref:BRO-N domain-containing protein n=1 Tax=Acinetobacter junii TaxID=40215 RepID=UPI003FA29B66
MKALVFQSSTINPIHHNDDQIWVTASDLAKALGYKQENAVSKIFNRNVDEFTECMTQLVDNPRLPKLGMRIFSLRGAHLIAMFSRTAVAKEFRKWVLDIIEKKESKTIKQVDKALYVSKELHNKVALKYHRMFRQYDDMIDHLRKQVDEMQCKCRRYDFRMKVNAKEIQSVAVNFGTSVARIKQILMDELLLEERNPYVETNKTVLNVTDRGKKLEFLFLQSEIVDGDIQDIIMITDDGMAYLRGRV